MDEATMHSQALNVNNGQTNTPQHVSKTPEELSHPDAKVNTIQIGRMFESEDDF